MLNQENDGDIDAKFKRGMSQSVTGGVLDREDVCIRLVLFLLLLLLLPLTGTANCGSSGRNSGTWATMLKRRGGCCGGTRRIP